MILIMIGMNRKAQNESVIESVSKSSPKSVFCLIPNLKEIAGSNKRIIINAPKAIFNLTYFFVTGNDDVEETVTVILFPFGNTTFTTSPFIISVEFSMIV